MNTLATFFSALTSDTLVANGLHKSAASAVELEPGMVVKLKTDGDIMEIDANTDKAYGIVNIGSKQLVYAPADNKIAVGTYTTILQGRGEAQMSADGFETVPTVGALLYPSVDGSGRLNTSQSGSIPAVGRCTAIDSIAAPEQGSTSVYRFTFEVPQF